ncbi:OmpA family protein [Paludibacter sp. 221]|uniref:OmpA family protein n=1 Tax=Paludibacter sp. 221 TaxID=2302939 RepID=UPI001EF2AD8B|nr:OmpA family protein [Paludibacter sp. 221]
MKVDLGKSFKNPLDHLTVGGTLGYTINPSYSIGLGYFYNTTGNEDAAGSFTSRIHHIYPYVGINVLNYAYEESSRWALWLNVGAGLARYTSSLEYADGSTDGEEAKNTGVIPLGVHLEFYLARNLALGLRVQHNIYTNDNIEGGVKKLETAGVKNYTYAGVSNDQLSNLNLSLRWNFTGKDKYHSRRVNWDVYAPENSVANIQDQISDLNNRMNGVEQRVDTIADRLAYVESLFDEGPDTDGDGVPDSRDLEPDTQGNTVLVDFWGRTIKTGSDIASISSIYFDFDKSTLNKEAMAIIANTAAKMKEDTSILLEVRGYTDPVGADPYNQKLSQRRADIIKNELVKTWGIDESRILANGKGKLLAPNKDYYSTSRRCDLMFSK